MNYEEFDKLTDEKEIWVQYIISFPDIFMTSYCGYWMRQIAFKDGLGHLAREDEGESKSSDKKAAKEFHKNGSAIEGYFLIDRELAEKAWDIGIRRWGEDWHENADSESYDIVMQEALFSDIIYG